MSYAIHIILLSGFTLLVIYWKFFNRKKRFLKYSYMFAVNFGLRLLLVYLNQQLHFFSPKLAGKIAADIQKSFLITGSPSLIHSNFLLQWVINFPFFELNGPTYTTILINNVFIGAVIPLIIAYCIFKKYGTGFENYTLLFFSFFPCFINFSIFGIRDILILAITAINAVASIYIYTYKSKTKGFYKSIFAYGLSLLFILFVRPEMIVMVGLPLFFLLLKSGLSIIHRIKKRYSRVLVASILAVVFLSMSFSFLYLANGFLASNIGASSPISVTETVNVYTQHRYDRQFKGRGGGSAILSPTKYDRMNIGSRLVVQMVGMVVIPFPWKINSITKLFAFVDTLIVLFLLFILLGAYFRQFKNKRINLRLFFKNPMNVLGLTYLFSTIIYGFLVINFGNAFRLRMSILPYLILPATYFLIHKKTLHAS